DEEASYHGEFVRFGPCWAWPKPVQRPRVPVLIGAGGTEKTFAWIVRSADGWITTPIETDTDKKVELLRRRWREAGREGSPEIAVLAGRPEREQLARWQASGVTEVIFGLPDKPQDEVVAYIARLARKLGIAAS
ncbi:MAG: LLM class flavin-dependent oxidoreductase, partial [Sciscionella sp.]